MPHIYVSALPFSPGSSIVSKNYVHGFPQLLSVQRGLPEQWSVMKHVLEGHHSAVVTIAFSPDGTQIVSGSWDHTIRVWDAQSGNVILGPLEGHSSSVCSVAFSPDGKQIVSGSSDHTIQVWDAQSGNVILSPLEGHSSSVQSVSFSPDGKQIVSGSSDHTIRVWDAQSGNVILRPSEGHSQQVNSVAFPMDSERIASGYTDNHIHKCNMQFDMVTPSGFTDSSTLQNGWVSNAPSTLLFWVPPSNRVGLQWPRNTLVIGPKPTILDTKHFVHGREWENCHKKI